jgi:hypothetical protein
MKASRLFHVSLLAIGMAASTGIARADSTDATCEVRKDGEIKSYGEDCTPEQKRESYEYAQRHR